MTQAFFMQTAKTLIRLGECLGWSESLLVAHAILLVLSWGGSFYDYIVSCGQTYTTCSRPWHNMLWLPSHCLQGCSTMDHKQSLSQLMRLWYLSHRRTAKAQARPHKCAVSPEPSLFAHIKFGSRRRVWPKIRRLAPVDCCACMFEDWVYRGREVP